MLQKLKTILDKWIKFNPKLDQNSVPFIEIYCDEDVNFLVSENGETLNVKIKHENCNCQRK